MTKPVSPIRKLTATCPLCLEEAQHLRIKDTLVRLNDLDIDMRPNKVQWSPKVEPKVDPKHYFFWQCNVCYYTSDWSFYQDPFEGTSLGANRYKKDLQKALNSDENYTSIISLLDISQDKSSFFRNLKLNLHAIYLQESLALTRDKECRPLAQYYLRYAWLLRDLRLSRKKTELHKIPLKNLLRSLRSIWPELPVKEIDIASKSCETYGKFLTGSSFLETKDEVQVNLMIARIWMQYESWDRAFERIRLARIKNLDLQALVSKPTNQKTLHRDLGKLKSQSTWCINQIQQVEKIYENYRDDAEQKTMDFYRQIIADHKDKPAEEIAKQLRALGASSQVVKSLIKTSEEQPLKKSPQKILNSIIKKIS